MFDYGDGVLLLISFAALPNATLDQEEHKRLT